MQNLKHKGTNCVHNMNRTNCVHNMNKLYGPMN